jgi:hypothetical protein
MIREPLVASDTPATSPNPQQSTPPAAWIAIVSASIFLALAFYHAFLMRKWKAWFSWTFVTASVVQCLSLVANAYDLAYPASVPWSALEGVVFP